MLLIVQVCGYNETAENLSHQDLTHVETKDLVINRGVIRLVVFERGRHGTVFSTYCSTLSSLKRTVFSISVNSMDGDQRKGVILLAVWSTNVITMVSITHSNFLSSFAVSISEISGKHILGITEVVLQQEVSNETVSGLSVLEDSQEVLFDLNLPDKRKRTKIYCLGDFCTMEGDFVGINHFVYLFKSN